MSISFHPEAERKFNDAIDYYEGCESGLGYDFAIAVSAAIRPEISACVSRSPLQALFLEALTVTLPGRAPQDFVRVDGYQPDTLLPMTQGRAKRNGVW